MEVSGEELDAIIDFVIKESLDKEFTKLSTGKTNKCKTEDIKTAKAVNHGEMKIDEEIVFVHDLNVDGKKSDGDFKEDVEKSCPPKKQKGKATTNVDGKKPDCAFKDVEKSCQTKKQKGKATINGDGEKSVDDFKDVGKSCQPKKQKGKAISRAVVGPRLSTKSKNKDKYHRNVKNQAQECIRPPKIIFYSSKIPFTYNFATTFVIIFPQIPISIHV